MKKCLNCGNVFLELHSYPTIAVGNHFNAYVCANCVHIDFYVSVDEIKGISKSKEKDIKQYFSPCFLFCYKCKKV